MAERGPALRDAFDLLERDGMLVQVGVAAGQPATLDFEAQRDRVSVTRIEAFGVGSHPIGADLPLLAQVIASGRLCADIGWRGSLDDIGSAIAALRDRRVRGKAFLLV